MKWFLSSLQISIIIVAVALTAIRLNSGVIPSLTPQVESWFSDQGLTADIKNTHLQLAGFNLELFVNGLELKDASNKSILDLQHAEFEIDLIKSLLKQKLVLRNASLFLDSLTLNASQYAELFQTSDNQPVDVQSLVKNEAVTKLMALHDLTLTIKQIQFTDKQQHQYVLYNSSFSLNDVNQTKQIQLASDLFKPLGEQLKVSLTVDKQAVLQQHKLLGNAYVELQVEDLKALAKIDKRIQSGGFETRNWLQFNDSHMVLQSQLKMNKVITRFAGETQKISADLNIISQLNEQNLSLQSVDSHMVLNDKTLQPFTILGATHLTSDRHFADSVVLLENANLDNVHSVFEFLPTLKKHRAFIKQLQAKGTLKKLLLAVDAEHLNNSYFAVQTGALSWQKVSHIPSVQGLSVHAEGSFKKFKIQASAKQLELGLTELFKQNSIAEDVNLQAFAYIQDNKQWAVNVPSFSLQRFETDAKGRLLIIQDAGSSPLMALRAQVNNANVKNAPQYYPEKIMDADVLHWLKASLIKGKVKTTDILYFGRLENDVNFDKRQNGIFNAVLKVNDADLRFDPEWPTAKIDHANVEFKNYQLKSFSQRGSMNGVKVLAANFDIDNLLDGVAQLHLVTQAPVKQHIDVLNKTPLAQLIPYFGDVKNVTGAAKASIDVTLPLANLNEKALPFTLAITGQKAGFELAQLGLNFKQFNSTIHLSDHSLTIPKTTLTWFSHPMTLEAKTDSKQIIQMTMNSKKLPIDKLWHYMPTDIPAFAHGNSDWNITMDMQLFSHSQSLITVKAHSDLVGTNIQLPMPLTKAANTNKPINLMIQIAGDKRLNVAVDWGKDLQASTSFAIKQGEYDLTQAVIGVGSKAAQTKLKGVFVDANIAKLDLGQWLTLLQDKNQSANQFNLSSLAKIKQFKVTIDQLQMGAFQSKANVFDINQSGKGLSGAITSTLLKGIVYIPLVNTKDAAITLNLDYLRLFPDEKIKTDTLITNPNFMPNLKLQSKELNYNGLLFSDLKLDINTSKKNNFTLNNLSLKQGEISLDVAGGWSVNNNGREHSSHLFIDAKGSDLGASLKALKVGDVFDKGNLTLSAQLFWKQPLFSMKMAKAQGKSHMLIKDGFIKDVDPGSGRFVGLLSLSTIPRRLSLDFSDFFKQGLKFESISGDFTFHDGSFWTDNLKLQGPSSKISIKGRTGIVARDYDQKITIIPQIGDTLPVLGSIISGGPTAWSLLLFQRLFKKEIDDSVTIKYDLTGSWDDPKLKLIPPPKTENTINNDSNL